MTMTMENTVNMNMSMNEIRQERYEAYATFEAMTAEFSRSVVMDDEMRRAVLGGVALGKLVLLGEPGEGKTLIATTLAAMTGGQFRRHQGTADAMPSDITGSGVFNEETRKMEFDRGPVLEANYFLEDEANRNPPRVQSALLEVMQEGQVSFRGKAVKALSPMTFIATMNPVDEEQGTYGLPFALIDRFDMSITPNYSDSEELTILKGSVKKSREAEQVADLSQISGLRNALEKIEISDDLFIEILKLKKNIKKTEGIDLKRSIIGNRIGTSIAKLARFYALTRGKEVENANREDIAKAFLDAVPHRITMKTEYKRQGYTTRRAVNDILKAAA